MTPDFYLTSNSSDPKKETVWIINRRDGLRVAKVGNREVAEQIFRRLTRRPGKIIDIRDFMVKK